VKKEDLDKYDRQKQKVWTQEEYELKVAIVKDNLEKVLHLDFPSEGLS
jgi:hypothetical protein